MGTFKELSKADVYKEYGIEYNENQIFPESREYQDKKKDKIADAKRALELSQLARKSLTHILKIRADLARLYMEEDSAIKYFDEAKTILDNVLEELKKKDRVNEEKGTLDAMCDLAMIHYAKGDVKEKKQTANMQTLNAVGDAFAALTFSEDLIPSVVEGYKKAEKLLSFVVKQRKVKPGPDALDTILTVHNLAKVYTEQGAHDSKIYKKASTNLTECVQKYTNLYGEGHPVTLNCVNDLALLYFKSGDYEKAEQYFDQCLEQREIKLGEAHPDTLKAKNNLAMLYHTRMEYSKAEPMYQQCMTFMIRRDILGPEHEYTLRLLNNLAGLYYVTGRNEDALDMFNGCLKFAQIKLDKMLGAGRDVQDSHETVNVKNNLAVLLKKMDRKAGDIDHHGNKLENNDIELAP